MNWYHYVACFFAGMFLTNAVPHFVHGISGDRFPTPFAHPPGKGLSSATVNVAWALANILAGFFLFQGGQMSASNLWTFGCFFAGIALISIMSSIGFRTKHPN
jgi:hypothetical protein